MFRVISSGVGMKPKFGGFFWYILRISRWLTKLKQNVVNIVKQNEI